MRRELQIVVIVSTLSHLLMATVFLEEDNRCAYKMESPTVPATTYVSIYKGHILDSPLETIAFENKKCRVWKRPHNNYIAKDMRYREVKSHKQIMTEQLIKQLNLKIKMIEYRRYLLTKESNNSEKLRDANLAITKAKSELSKLKKIKFLKRSVHDPRSPPSDYCGSWEHYFTLHKPNTCIRPKPLREGEYQKYACVHQVLEGDDLVCKEKVPVYHYSLCVEWIVSNSGTLVCKKHKNGYPEYELPSKRVMLYSSESKKDGFKRKIYIPTYKCIEFVMLNNNRECLKLTIVRPGIEYKCLETTEMEPMEISDVELAETGSTMCMKYSVINNSFRRGYEGVHIPKLIELNPDELIYE